MSAELLAKTRWWRISVQKIVKDKLVLNCLEKLDGDEFFRKNFCRRIIGKVLLVMNSWENLRVDALMQIHIGNELLRKTFGRRIVANTCWVINCWKQIIENEMLTRNFCAGLCGRRIVEGKTKWVTNCLEKIVGDELLRKTCWRRLLKNKLRKTWGRRIFVDDLFRRLFEVTFRLHCRAAVWTR